MYSFIFGLFSIAFLLLYGMVHTFFFVKKIKQESECKKKYTKYGNALGLYACISFIMGVALYYYGVG